MWWIAIAGTQHQQRFVNILGTKGPLVFDADQDSENRTFYAEDSFFMFSDLALVAGGPQPVPVDVSCDGFRHYTA